VTAVPAWLALERLDAAVATQDRATAAVAAAARCALAAGLTPADVAHRTRQPLASLQQALAEEVDSDPSPT
jgi:hypothetical protein